MLRERQEQSVVEVRVELGEVATRGASLVFGIGGDVHAEVVLTRRLHHRLGKARPGRRAAGTERRERWCRYGRG
ncbi:hypothetical protein GCM10025876_16800 [Demequina litorisediminis]|uniref:Uncharacterized protein n=1 Tax=Demequina litorisediminis TaxID=1849022 RepID=A0ABQ6IE61_9MICO|nr:hypothetical protein GCM10025876_16800 [Demequina litorisediminis]